MQRSSRAQPRRLPVVAPCPHQSASSPAGLAQVASPLQTRLLAPASVAAWRRHGLQLALQLQRRLQQKRH